MTIFAWMFKWLIILFSFIIYFIFNGKCKNVCTLRPWISRWKVFYCILCGIVVCVCIHIYNRCLARLAARSVFDCYYHFPFDIVVLKFPFWSFRWTNFRLNLFVRHMHLSVGIAKSRKRDRDRERERLTLISSPFFRQIMQNDFIFNNSRRL